MIKLGVKPWQFESQVNSTTETCLLTHAKYLPLNLLQTSESQFTDLLPLWQSTMHSTNKEYIKIQTPACRPHRRRGQHRDNGGCPFSCHEATQFILYLYVSGTSRSTVPLLEPRMRKWNWVEFQGQTLLTTN